MSKRVIIAVTNDLSSDRRIEKLAHSLLQINWSPKLVGRQLPHSKPFKREYPYKRFKLLFNKGALFYANYNIRLFLYLLFAKYDAIHSNDLDTLPACYFAANLRGKKLIYDSHEYYTEVPELINRPFQRNFWLFWEKLIFPRLKHVVTVNHKIASAYQNKYKVPVGIVRNVPLKTNHQWEAHAALQSSTKFNLILQGAGINVDRGAEELVEAFQYLPEAFHLYIIGSGDVWTTLEQKVEELGLKNQITLMQRIPYQELMQYTAGCQLGVTLDKPTNLNYRYSLPNKLFDYFQAGVPVLSSNVEVVSGIVNDHNVGWISPNHTPKELAQLIQSIKENSEAYQEKRANALKTAALYNWEEEIKPIQKLYESWGS